MLEVEYKFKLPVTSIKTDWIKSFTVEENEFACDENGKLIKGFNRTECMKPVITITAGKFSHKLENIRKLFSVFWVWSRLEMPEIWVETAGALIVFKGKANTTEEIIYIKSKLNEFMFSLFRTLYDTI